MSLLSVSEEFVSEFPSPDWLEIELLLGNGPRAQRCKAIGIDK
jgi:hypothetical protein